MDYYSQIELIITGLLLALVTILLIIWNRSIDYRRWSSTTHNQPSPYSFPYPPSPLGLPVIGHLFQLARYPTNPWLGFEAIRQRYGDVVRLQLGMFPTVMVSSLEAIREVLLVKGDVFSDRPHFDRHALIFGSNRQNALALCDWTDNHKMRRSIAHAAVIPRFGTKCFDRLSECIQGSICKLMKSFDDEIRDQDSIVVKKKSFVKLCCEIFVEFLLEQKVNDDDVEFEKISNQYDLIFYDINQMYVWDFLPFLKPFLARKYLKSVQKNAIDLREYIEEKIKPRFETLLQQKGSVKQVEMNTGRLKKTGSGDSGDSLIDDKCCEERFVDRILLQKQYQSKSKFLDFILKHYLENRKSMSWEECLYEIGDLVGGNSAVANLLVRLLGYLTINPKIQRQLYEEAVSVVDSKWNRKQAKITLEDRPHMPLTNAAIMETLRLSSSPIVPHLARYDTSIQGYYIPKRTMILFNLYNLNFNTSYWNDPYSFEPSRFVTPNGNVLKPEYFFPFSHGRRSCLGYKMVNTIIFATVANLLLRYELKPTDENNTTKIYNLLEPKCTIALPIDDDCYYFRLSPRNDP